MKTYRAIYTVTENGKWYTSVNKYEDAKYLVSLMSKTYPDYEYGIKIWAVEI